MTFLEVRENCYDLPSLVTQTTRTNDAVSQIFIILLLLARGNRQNLRLTMTIFMNIICVEDWRWRIHRNVIMLIWIYLQYAYN